ncbi:ABC transporter ATP-binding protein [Aquincola sp. MAHUQ-54]|uniref:ABC transporter ATP-binding protein n=1 Tax=Aquincola agrisoli TaxID=3119538 RepID=A0AAW9Q925_9BURK
MPPTDVVLAAEGLQVRRGGRVVVDGIGLRLRAGEWLAIVGPNGAGKSTLLSALAGLLPVQAGSVQLEGRPLPAWPARERARRLAWLSQQGEADGDIAVRDVVRLGRLPHQGLFGAATAADDAAVEAAMAETECLAFAGRRLNALSGGERQRVLLARALAVQAPVLLLDEPTSHLDAPHQRALVRSLMARARAGTAVASVLHELTLALAANRLLVMAAGRVRAEGPPADPAVRQALVEVFDHAFDIERVAGGRWVAVPIL